MKFSTLMFLALSSVVAPLAMAQSTPPDGGLLITRVNSEQWQIRLISGTTAQQFSGVMQSNMPITALSTIELESVDSAKLLTPASLGVTFAAWPGGVDGVDFTVSADAKLCLRDTGGSGVHIYLGDSLADALPVTASVALTSADACGDTTPPVLPASSRKFHTGHYIALGRNASTQAIMAQSIEPGVVGFMKRYTWRSLEPTQGVYQFAGIKSDLAWAAANGIRLVVMIEDRTFTPEKAGPAYLDQYDLRTRTGGYTMVRWSPVVMTRWKALVKALGAQVDSNKNFEGLATQETSLGFDSTQLHAFAYTPEKYRDSYIDILTDATKSLPTSRVFWFMNYLAGGQNYLADIASAVAPLGVVMGGPDVWPDNQSLASKVYPLYTQFAGKLPMFGQVEDVCYRAPHMTSGYHTKYWTMTELFNFARSKMHVNYMFWVRITQASPADAYDWLDALPVIATNTTF